jgi:hypothetical protein
MSDRVETELLPERLDYLRRQEFLYERAKPELLQRFAGEFIVFENGAVLDHDRDERALLHRVYRQHGYRDLLIKRVLPIDPHLSVGGAFTEFRELP